MHQQTIVEAISAKKVIEFTYDGARQQAEPHVFGVKGGVPLVLAYRADAMVNAVADSEWWHFDIDKISDLTLREESFDGPRQCVSMNADAWDYIVATTTP